MFGSIPSASGLDVMTASMVPTLLYLGWILDRAELYIDFSFSF